MKLLKQMQFITIIFLNQQSKVSTFISQDLKHSCYSWYFSVVLTSMLVAMIRMMMSMRQIENINIMNMTLFAILKNHFNCETHLRVSRLEVFANAHRTIMSRGIYM